MSGAEKTKTGRNSNDAEAAKIFDEILRSDDAVAARLFKEILRSSDAEEGSIELDMSKFAADPFYESTLLRDCGFPGSTRSIDIVQFDDAGIKFWRQKEGCFHTDMVTPIYRLTWEQVEALSKAEKTLVVESFVIAPKDAAKLIELRDAKAHNYNDISRVLQTARSEDSLS